MSKYNKEDIIMVKDINGNEVPLLLTIKCDDIEMKFPVLKPGTIMMITKCRRHEPTFGVITKKEKYQIDCMDIMVQAPNPCDMINNIELTQEFCETYFIYGDEIDNDYNSIDKDELTKG